ncbi:hypothetical protein V6N13_047302 [Hibiscus sabdariffa]|uniref:Uncharacterized protein n=1 Tax=Hibiscus sabdariffa TaxID=183260 RepID=A0ABR2F3Q3_9ROSI
MPWKTVFAAFIWQIRKRWFYLNIDGAVSRISGLGLGLGSIGALAMGLEVIQVQSDSKQTVRMVNDRNDCSSSFSQVPAIVKIRIKNPCCPLATHLLVLVALSGSRVRSGGKTEVIHIK